MTQTVKILSFHGKVEIKEEFLARLQAHYEADEIIKGKYWQNGKGCAVGCTVHSSRHDDYPTQLGISWRLALIEDSLFEKLPNAEAKEFPLQFLKAIPIGVYTDVAFKKFILWNIADEKEGLLAVVKDEKVRDLLEGVVKLYRESETREVSQQEWQGLADRAASASAYASASASAYASASASASASAYASASASASAYAYASASAYASAYAYASASASAYASAYAYAYAYASREEWQKIFDARILLMRDRLLQFLTELK